MSVSNPLDFVFAPRLLTDFEDLVKQVGGLDASVRQLASQIYPVIGIREYVRYDSERAYIVVP